MTECAKKGDKINNEKRRSKRQIGSNQLLTTNDVTMDVGCLRGDDTYVCYSVDLNTSLVIMVTKMYYTCG